jgi:PadR family transcriptional regulator, regulatory protein AphA
MPARHAILGLLMQRPLHGYDIDGEFEKGLRNICHINISQIYAYLKSMEEQGWIENETIMQKSSPPKKVYHVTPEGRAEMERWLQQPSIAERQMRDELLTKMYFCRFIAPDELHRLIEDQLRVHKQHLEQIHERIEQSTDFFAGLLLDAGRRHAEADYEWLLWMRDQLRENRDLLVADGGAVA